MFPLSIDHGHYKLLIVTSWFVAPPSPAMSISTFYRGPLQEKVRSVTTTRSKSVGLPGGETERRQAPMRTSLTNGHDDNYTPVVVIMSPKVILSTPLRLYRL